MKLINLNRITNIQILSRKKVEIDSILKSNIIKIENINNSFLLSRESCFTKILAL